MPTAAALRPSSSPAFDRAFAGLSPQAFVADVLEGRLDARHVLVGADFCYGKGRAGTVTTLLEAGAQNGFAVTVVPPFLLHQERISSTQIRRLVARADCRKPWSFWDIRSSCRAWSAMASSWAGRWATRPPT